MAVSAVVLLVWKMKIVDIAMQSIAVMGLAFTALALVSGAVWETNPGHVLGGMLGYPDANPRDSSTSHLSDCVPRFVILIW